VFTQADTWEGDITNPQTLNPYSYVLGNPLIYTDPSGNYPQKEWEKKYAEMALDLLNRGSQVGSPTAGLLPAIPPLVKAGLGLIGSWFAFEGASPSTAHTPVVGEDIDETEANQPMSPLEFMMLARAGYGVAKLGLGIANRFGRAAGLPSRKPILADNDLLVHAAERGSASALAEIRRGPTYLTLWQYREFMNVNTSAQKASRIAFLQREGIQVLDAGTIKLVVTSPGYQELFFKIAISQRHGKPDAMLAAFAKFTGYEAVTMEKSIYNHFRYSYPQYKIPIRRVMK
jgi:hypothetical protein